MELTEKELLIRIDEQIKVLSAAHRDIVSEISSIYDKQDRDSKVLVVLSSEFKSQADSLKSLKEDTTKQCSSNRNEQSHRIDKTENQIDKLFAEVDKEKSQFNDLKNTLSTISNKIDQGNVQMTTYIDKKIKEEATERESFQNKLTTTLGNTKIFMGVLMFLFSIVTSILVPLITAVLKDMLVK